ncbi:hypothetical protein [Oscillatoria nigro-viridis]|uniref:hypothetical protein n=1 Tax=Phormidium nigroviride TaxID=482564 RepID=UPI00059FBBE4|nr:hypothetical protein [Oscillatoria nigro-viridis]
MASVFQVCDRTRLSGGDIALLLYLCGWLCGDSPGDGVGPEARATAKVTAIPKKSDCDEFNWLWDTNDPLLYSSLLILE